MLNTYNTLAKLLQTSCSVNVMKQALTHVSFYEQTKKSHTPSANSNSRYVFAGQFAFRGLVADTLYRYVPGSGQQLQQILGNFFKSENLERIFVYYDLDKLARLSPDFDMDTHKHIFVYGLLGFVFTHSPESFIQIFINQHFILPNRHLIFHDEKNRDFLAQCNFFAKSLYNAKIREENTKENELNKYKIFINQQIIAEKTSKSYRYARTGALKQALIVLGERAEQLAVLNPDYASRQLRMEEIRLHKMEEVKKEKQMAYQEKVRQKKEARSLKKAQQKQEAIQKDVKRRKDKIVAKARKEVQQRIAAAAAAKMENMSANKRRHLQDKGQL